MHLGNTLKEMQGMTTNTGDTSNDFLNSESWQTARSYIATLLPVPPTIKDVIRTFWRENHEGSFSFHPGHLASLRLLERSSLFLSILEQAAKDICPDRLRDNQATGSRSQVLLSCLGKNTFAAIIALSFVQRRIHKQILEDVQKRQISRTMNKHAELGHALGSIFERPGPGSALLFSGIRAPVYGLLIHRHTSGNHIPEIAALMKKDAAYETNTWGCTAAQVSCILLKELGFQFDLHQLHAAFSGELETSLPPFYQSTRAVLNWVKHFEYTVEQPEQRSPFEPLIPTAAQFAFLLNYRRSLQLDGGRFHWLETAATS